MCHVCPSWLSFILYNPIRKRLSDRGKILHESGITKDSIVLEIGAGNGFLTEAIAGHAKKVVVVELQEGMVRKLRKRISGFAGKVETVTADIAVYQTDAPFADVCLLYYCFHEVADKPAAVKNITRAVKSGGYVSIYEPGVEVGEKDMIETVRLFTDAGFEKEMEHKNIFTRFARLRKTEVS
ncbi:MAG: class I SAM-dependent methyltransferase [Nitrospirae bacterium]|nr:class I SAM-dependent methyltransferase [Nitrospirota bacterium]